MERHYTAPEKAAMDLPRFPVAAYSGRRPFNGSIQLPTSRTQPPQEKPQQRSRSSDKGSLTPESSRPSSAIDAVSSAECDSLFGISK